MCQGQGLTRPLPLPPLDIIRTPLTSQCLLSVSQPPLLLQCSCGSKSLVALGHLILLPPPSISSGPHRCLTDVPEPFPGITGSPAAALQPRPEVSGCARLPLTSPPLSIASRLLTPQCPPRYHKSPCCCTADAAPLLHWATPYLYPPPSGIIKTPLTPHYPSRYHRVPCCCTAAADPSL